MYVVNRFASIKNVGHEAPHAVTLRIGGTNTGGTNTGGARCN